MSLVYDALKQQGDPALPGRPAPRASWWARQSPRRREGLLLAAGAVLAAPLAFLAASALSRPESTPASTAIGSTPPASTGIEPAPPAVAAAAAPAVTGGAPEAGATAPAYDHDAGAMAPPADVPTATAAGQQVAEAGEPTPQDTVPEAAPDAPGSQLVPAAAPHAATGPALPAQSAPSAPSAAPINIKVEQRASARAQGTGGNEVDVRHSVRAIEAAVAAGDFDAARQALASLESMLHADSLTLLRMRAWVAHGSEDMAAAEQLYRRIAERVPDDINAGVNIALLDARRGDVADARSRLRRLSNRHSRSPQVARALAELDALPQ
ncbi:tetratricopeptide repeat protein [Luteimonas granuli]|uniref:Tetratricopeptide repeat protein n=1 Tax=Luteimonas granuli TaxID=1176533 RepID=A0A518N6D1_9GAMM|nr:tetratricopeptide repeat protein [Luteimonas granuli]QDW67460.1 hypothetical protein FPZ22_11700 [Luteimonas granuli]